MSCVIGSLIKCNCIFFFSLFFFGRKPKFNLVPFKTGMKTMTAVAMTDCQLMSAGLNFIYILYRYIHVFCAQCVPSFLL
ncbi:Uncharacterized protein APZ42_018503 [Daphnia magna]|uniref:Uncharacterized protein n=1 Tax=Daphnia magna TaxID=35525 RepID=A0A164Z287_9CRUS|nr:Uncharacterized protein APZ42_018503 [Daphnia magna]